MDKDLYNILFTLQSFNPKHEEFFRYKIEFDEFENGKLLEAIVN